MPHTLLHVGYVKTGSTWLQWKVLNESRLGFRLLIRSSIAKGIIAPYPLWYDPEPIRAELDQAVTRCHEEGVVGVLSHERISGSPMTGGYDSPIIARRLVDLLPNARVLLVFREQRDHLRSIYNEFVALGGHIPLEVFLDPPLLARTPLFDPRFLEFHRLIQLYHQLFGPRNVLAVPFEILKRDPSRLLHLILDLVDLPQANAPDADPVRTSQGAATISMLRRSNLFFDRNNANPGAPFDWPFAARVVKRIGRSLPRSVHRWADRGRRNIINEAIGERYAASNRETAKLTGFDLADFGYPV